MSEPRDAMLMEGETLIDDAKAEIRITAEAFQEPVMRRLARQRLRRALQKLDPRKELGAIVWVIGYAPRTAMFTLAAFVGGRRSHHAAMYRREIRSAGALGEGASDD